MSNTIVIQTKNLTLPYSAGTLFQLKGFSDYRPYGSCGGQLVFKRSVRAGLFFMNSKSVVLTL